MTQRDAIALTPAEQKQYVATARTLTLCSNGPHGYPHAVAMWFVADEDGTVWMTTYRKAQKAVNLQRDPKVALHIESGETYGTLKGMLIRGNAEIVSDKETVFQTLRRVHEKMSGAFPDAAGVEDVMRWQARKRVALKITPCRVSSWDHAKLGGGY